MDYSLYNCDDTETAEAIEFLVHCSLEDLSCLEDISCISELTCDTDDIESKLSSSVDDLEEWFADEFVFQGNEIIESNDTNSPTETLPKIDVETEHQISLAAKSLEQIMCRTQMSRQSLRKRLNPALLSDDDSVYKNTKNRIESEFDGGRSSFKKLKLAENDHHQFQKTFFTGKRHSSTSEVEASRNRFKEYNVFFTGKRNSLTAEVEASRNRLKTLGISFKHTNLEFKRKNVLYDRSQVVCRSENAPMA